MTDEAQRYRRWRKAATELEQNATDGTGDQFFDALITEEQEAWDAMADHDDPEYVRRLEAQ